MGRSCAAVELLADLQNPASPNYHHWLTAAEYGDRFGLSAGDFGQTRAWLEAQGRGQMGSRCTRPSHAARSIRARSRRAHLLPGRSQTTSQPVVVAYPRARRRMC
jgi:hypothetical protein